MFRVGIGELLICQAVNLTLFNFYNDNNIIGNIRNFIILTL